MAPLAPPAWPPLISPLLTMTFSNSCRSPSLEAIKTVSSAYLELFVIWPPKLTPGSPSMCRIIYLLYTKNKSRENTHPCRTPFFYFTEVTYSIFNSYGCSLLPVHISDDSQIFAFYIYSFEEINYFLVFYAIKCFGVINKAPFTRERNGTERNGPERNGTERNFLMGVHTAMDRFEVLISSSPELQIF